MMSLAIRYLTRTNFQLCFNQSLRLSFIPLLFLIIVKSLIVSNIFILLLLMLISLKRWALHFLILIRKRWLKIILELIGPIITWRVGIKIVVLFWYLRNLSIDLKITIDQLFFLIFVLNHFLITLQPKLFLHPIVLHKLIIHLGIKTEIALKFHALNPIAYIVHLL